MVYRVQTAKSLAGEIEPPGDKSISHRAAMLGGLAQGTTIVENFLHGEDTEATMNCLRSLGVEIHVGRTESRLKGTQAHHRRARDARDSGSRSRCWTCETAVPPCE